MTAVRELTTLTSAVVSFSKHTRPGKFTPTRNQKCLTEEPQISITD